jgi:hypothetical protein
MMWFDLVGQRFGINARTSSLTLVVSRACSVSYNAVNPSASSKAGSVLVQGRIRENIVEFSRELQIAGYFRKLSALGAVWKRKLHSQSAGP